MKKQNSSEQARYQRSLCTGHITLLGIWCFLAHMADYLTYIPAIISWIILSLLVIVQTISLHRSYDKLLSHCKKSKDAGCRIATGGKRKANFGAAVTISALANMLLAVIPDVPIWCRAICGAMLVILACRVALFMSITPQNKKRG